MNIIIYGIGQLGSRHLQGLAGIGEEHTITAYDPSVDSIEIAKERWGQTKGKEQVSFISDQQQLLNKTFDLAIVATGSKPRLEAIEFLINLKTKLFILEKVLFQSSDEYETALRLFKENDAKAWVNCPRRMFGHYKSIRDLLKDEKEMFMTVSGGNWGLACNGVHFLDLFAFLTNENKFTGDINGLIQGIHASKRQGYYELNGSLSFFNEDRSKFLCLNSKQNGLPGVRVQISSDNYDVLIDEFQKKMVIKSLNEENVESIDVPFQSQLTGTVVKQLLNNKCELTEFSESSNVHLSLLLPLMEHFGKFDKAFSKHCPIT